MNTQYHVGMIVWANKGVRAPYVILEFNDNCTRVLIKRCYASGKPFSGGGAIWQDRLDMITYFKIDVPRTNQMRVKDALGMYDREQVSKAGR